MGVTHAFTLDTQYKDSRSGAAPKLRQHVAIYAQGASTATYSTDKIQPTGAAEVGAAYGYGSPMHLIAKVLWPRFAASIEGCDVTFHPLEDGTTAAAGDITPGGTQSSVGEYQLKAGGEVSDVFVIPADSSVADVCDILTAAGAAALDLPITVTDSDTKVTTTSKWKGASANDIVVEVVVITDGGMTFAITQPTGGAGNPDVDDALGQVGETWESMLLNAFEFDDAVTLGKFSVWGEGRWNKNTHKPAVVFTGNTQTTPADAYAVSDARPTDRVNAYLMAPGSKQLPCVAAAAQLKKIAERASAAPPRGYLKMVCPEAIPGSDADSWDYTKRELAGGKGCSNSLTVDGVLKCGDVFTFYKPTGELPPAYRKVVHIVRLQNTLHAIDLKLGSDEWASAPLLPNGQPTDEPSAKYPNDAVGDCMGVVETLGLNAILADTATTKKLITASISGDDADELTLKIPVKLSSNTDKIAGVLEYGFNFNTDAG